MSFDSPAQLPMLAWNLTENLGFTGSLEGHEALTECVEIHLEQLLGGLSSDAT